MARPAATEQQRQEQRDRIRHAAAAIHRTDGVGGLTVRAVAKEAGVSPGLIYRYFDNMSDLLRSIWIGPVVAFGRRVDHIVETEPDPVERIRALLNGYVDWAAENPEVLRGLLLFVRPGSEELSDPSSPEELALPRALRAAVIEGQAAGRIRSGDPDEHTQVLWAGVHGALALPINLDRYAITPGGELAAAMIETLLTALTTDEVDRAD
ncbi:MAG: TetR/AcrR family transcriptional regulator [Actinomycetota bacterium]